MNPTQDGQKSRSSATQKAIMLAAEKLIAAKGIENVSIREIVKAAGQKMGRRFNITSGIFAAWLHQSD